ncbi:phosphodiester glycosidase family protein [Streptomyces sp. M10(2022)]
MAVRYRARTDSGAVPRTAVGGRELLVVDGAALNHDGEGNNTAAPRTAVGFSEDGRTMQVITVDGRQADSGGVTLTELGLMMRRAGSYSALNLDGGGSSTLVAREPGSDTLQVENSPSDGSERTVPNGLALTAPTGAAGWTASGWRPAPRPDRHPAPTRRGRPPRTGLPRPDPAAHGRGLRRDLRPRRRHPRWRTVSPAVGRVDSWACSPRAAAARPASGPNARARTVPQSSPCWTGWPASSRPHSASGSRTRRPPAHSGSSAWTRTAPAPLSNRVTSASTTTMPCSTSTTTAGVPSP